MHRFHAWLGGLLLCVSGIFVGAHAARADEGGPSRCEKRGEVCFGEGFDGSALREYDGTCQFVTCTKNTGNGPVTYDHLGCVPTSGFGGASSVDNGGAGTSNALAAACRDVSSTDHGCSLSPARSDAALTSGAALLGLAAFGWSRRRR